MSPHRSQLVRMTLLLDQLNAAAAELVGVIHRDQLIDAVDLRDMVVGMARRVEQAIHDLGDPALDGESSVPTAHSYFLS